jgi:hypothetical protein
MKSIRPIHFIDKLVKKNELGQPFRLSDHQREVLKLAFALIRSVAYRGIRFCIAASRRAAIGKATPGTFQPSLQIDGTGAKLLIEALSGRWSYDTDRRDTKRFFFPAANALSLLVATIAPMPSNEQIKVISNYNG